MSHRNPYDGEGHIASCHWITSRGILACNCTGLRVATVGTRIDLNTHPLSDFFRAVVGEYERGLNKYGEWKEKGEQWQQDAVESECLEWKATTLSDKHEAREMQELTHMGNVAGKRYNEIRDHLDQEHEAKTTSLE